MSKWGFLWGAGRRLRVGVGVSLAGLLGVLVIAALALVTQAGATQSTLMVQVQRAGGAPAGFSVNGAPAATASQSGEVVLKPRDPAALQAFVSSVTAKHSADYHHYLAGGAFAAKFGPTAATLNAVKSTLSSAGLKVTGVSSNHMLVSFSGDTAQVESAFDTKLERLTSSSGHSAEETTQAVRLPSTISSQVTGVLGLDSAVSFHDYLTRGSGSAFADHPAAKTADITDYPSGSPKPCDDATTAANQFGGLTDDQIANAYGAFGEYKTNDTGAGVHVGVYELEPFLTSDLQTFDSCYFGASAASTMVNDQLTVNNVDGGPGSGSGSGEAILDVEDVSAMAPGADIDVYQAPNSTAGGLEAYAAMVDADTDKIISSSWGECEASLQQYAPGYQQSEYYVFEQAAAQGQTVLSAAGDTGDDTCNAVRSTPPPTDQNPLSVNDPSSQPYVMAVGGTTIQDADPADYNETVWNDGATWGSGGGGISSTWAAPSWQTAVSGFPLTGSSDYKAADQVEEDSATNGISESGEPWNTPTSGSTYTEFCATNTAAGFSASTPCRTLPDVSAQADEFTGAITVFQASQATPTNNGGWSTTGGTSSATPIWAGMLALVDASATCKSDGVSTDTGVGFVPPELYGIAGSASEYADSFHDITVGNNDVYGFDDGAVFSAGTGYDLASGLGSPILTNSNGSPGLAANLCALASTSTGAPSITALAPASGSVAGGGTETVTLSAAPPSGVTVSSITVGAARVTSATLSGKTVAFTLPAGASSLSNGTTTATNSDDTTFVSAGSTGTQDGAGPAEITVTFSNGQSTQLSTNSLYEYYDTTSSLATPTVTGVSPYVGLESSPAQVTVYGSDFKGTGVKPDLVFVGSVQVPADDIDVLSNDEMKITPPAFSSSKTNCATAAAITAETQALGSTDSDPAADDICQTNITVEDQQTGKTSTAAPAIPAYEGPAVATNQDGAPEVPEGYELSPTPTEFDYIPTPTITSVDALSSNTSTTPTPETTSDPSTLADASGGTIVVLTGTGLNDLTLDSFLVGDPTQNSSIDYSTSYDTGTEAVLKLPADPNVTATTPIGTAPDDVPIAASTVPGNSAAASAIYAGVPVVSGVTLPNTDAGYPVSVDTGGGGAMTITGKGFSDVTGPLMWSDISTSASYPDFDHPTQYDYTVKSDTSITTEMPQSNPGVMDTEPCTESGCASPVNADRVLAYPPGNPQITSIDTSSGPADGGTTVTISGENLGCVTSVDFGGVAALTATNATQVLDCGSTSTVTVITPPGTAGQTVPITLTTVESDVQTPAVTATSPTSFTYETNPSASTPSYGSVDIGSSDSQTVTVTNPGANGASLGQATVSGTAASQFAIGSDNCSDVTLGSGDSCTLAVTFTPTNNGTQSATLNLPFNDSPTNLTVSLTGTGVVPTTTVTSPPVTVTQTTTVPGTSTTTTKTYTCTTVTRYRIKTVTRKVKVKVHGRYKIITKKVKIKVPYKAKSCKLTSTTTTSSSSPAKR